MFSRLNSVNALSWLMRWNPKLVHNLASVYPFVSLLRLLPLPIKKKSDCRSLKPHAVPFGAFVSCLSRLCFSCHDVLDSPLSEAYSSLTTVCFMSTYARTSWTLIAYFDGSLLVISELSVLCTWHFLLIFTVHTQCRPRTGPKQTLA